MSKSRAPSQLLASLARAEMGGCGRIGGAQIHTSSRTLGSSRTTLQNGQRMVQAFGRQQMQTRGYKTVQEARSRYRSGVCFFSSPPLTHTNIRL